MSKINKISGFPELLPQEKLLEDKIISIIKKVYQSYGFTPIETQAVELVTTLQSKGVIDKEIYLLKRAKQEDGEESDLALHFDLTVPLARYVGQHFSELKFPFKRYQLQKVWRGERPQKGRFREFYQFDIDTISQNELPLACDAEVISAVGDVFTKLNIGSFKIKLNSRKILRGLYEGLGLSEPQIKTAIIEIDKINKIGAEGVMKGLLAAGISEKAAQSILKSVELKYSAKTYEEVSPGFLSSSDTNPMQAEGYKDLAELLKLTCENARSNIEIDMSLARGLDYYTGTILEVVLDNYPEFGSVCSGGRYEDLASQFINKKLPGVGVSIGLGRLMDLILSNKLLTTEGLGITKVLVAVYDESQRPQCNKLAEQLRSLDVPTEVFYKSPKLGKQIDYASDKAIPYVIFLNAETSKVEVKNLSSKEQSVIENVEAWAKSISA